MPNTPLEPDQIRVIREGLGLSQREAGQFLGGGPNAFAKYESGVLAPAAALANLLLVLKENPSALGTLQPGRASVAFSLPLPFEVTSQHIGCITEQTFPQLLRLLLQTEAQSFGIPLHGIHVAANVDAPDGGEDGRIQWEGGPAQTRFLPSRLTQFQLKTGNISPATARKEVLTKAGEVKPMVRSALEAGSTYIVLSTHTYTQQQLEAREGHIRDALRKAGLAIEDNRIQFRDASQLALWVNTHPAVATWLLEKVESGLLGPFRSWSHWAGRPEIASPWIEDERLNKLRQFLDQQAIHEPRSIARVVGLWGIGKSRLAFEALRLTAPDGSACSHLSSLVLYAVESDAGSEAIKITVQRLADSGARAVVVVDQCPLATHRAIAGMVERETSQLSLLTLDDEIPAEALRESTHRVDEAPDAVTEAIINQVAPGLQGEDQRRVAQFSRGFPKLSILIAQAWQESHPLGHATDEDLVKAYILGRNSHEAELLLKSARLLAAFGLVEIDSDSQNDSQVDRIANLGRNMKSQDLRAGVTMLVKRDVVRRWGRYVSIEPRPIMMRLVEQQWEEWDRKQWEAVLTDGNPSTMMLAGDLRLNAQAAKQLKLLNQPQITIAQKVVEYVCRYGGPFDGLKGILDSGHAEVLSHLAEIDTRAVANQITRSLDDVEDLLRITGDARRHLVWALEKITFSSDTFEDGACLLLRLAAAENEQWVNNATGQFVAPFQVDGGSTEVDGATRLALLDQLSKRSDMENKEKKILIDALVKGLQLDYWWRTVGPEAHGARPELKPWHPETVEEYHSYIDGCVTRLARFAAMNNTVGAHARTTLGAQLRSLVQHGFINTIEKSIVEQIGTVVTHWPEALVSLNHYLSYDSAAAPGETVRRVRELIHKLEPQSLEERLHFLINEMPMGYLATEEDEHDCDKITQRQANKVRAFATEAIQQPERLRSLLPQLSLGKQWTDIFGQTLAQCSESWKEWLESIIQVIEETSEAERRYDLLIGYIVGLADRQPAAIEEFKQRAATSPILAPTLPRIYKSLDITASDLTIIISALQNEVLSPLEIRNMRICDISDKILLRSAVSLLDVLLDHGNEGFISAVHFLGTYLYDDQKLNVFRPQILKIAENLSHYSWNDWIATIHFKKLMTWMLQKGLNDQGAKATAMALAKAVVNISDVTYNNSRNDTLRGVLPILLSQFSEVVWPIIGSAIIHSDHLFRFKSLMLDQHQFGTRDESPLLSLPADTLLEWCHDHPERAPAFTAGAIPLLNSGDENDNICIHPAMLRLIEDFGDHRDVIKASNSNMCSGLSIGPMEAFYEKSREPVKLLLNHPNNKVRCWAKAILRIIQDEVKRARIIDAEREACFRG